MFDLVLSWSGQVRSGLVWSCVILPYLDLTCLVLSCLVSCKILVATFCPGVALNNETAIENMNVDKEKMVSSPAFLVLSCLVLSCLVLSCLVLSCLVLVWFGSAWFRLVSLDLV